MRSRNPAAEHVPQVRHLEVRPVVSGERLSIWYEADDRPATAIHVRYPFELVEVDRRLVPLMTAGAALYLGQLGLARTIRVSTPLPDGLRAHLQLLGAHLYDVRCWRDDVPLVDPPVLLGGPGEVMPVDLAVDDSCVQLLWSGGKDSTLSAVRLLHCGYDVRALHISINHGVQGRELAAVTQLSARLGLPFDHVDVDHSDFLDYSSRHARAWNLRPHRNVVPFGRDLLLPLLALPHVVRSRSHAISLGHDRDCRTAWVQYEGRQFPRNDVECREDALVLEECLATYGIEGLTLFPPVAGMSEFAVLRSMLIDHPQLMAKTSSCFWPGTTCGECAKCLRYYLAQRVLEVDGVLQFKANPLAEDACPDLDEVLAAPEEAGALFGREILFCLGTLAERGDIRPGETALRAYATSDRHRRVSTQLGAWEAELLCETDDPQCRGRLPSSVGAVGASI